MEKNIKQKSMLGHLKHKNGIKRKNSFVNSSENTNIVWNFINTFRCCCCCWCVSSPSSIYCLLCGNIIENYYEPFSCDSSKKIFFSTTEIILRKRYNIFVACLTSNNNNNKYLLIQTAQRKRLMAPPQSKCFSEAITIKVKTFTFYKTFTRLYGIRLISIKRSECATL